jgi:hypothetical protein
VTLHQIIDALPEERLQNVERVLQYEGITSSEIGCVGSGAGRIPDEIAARIREQLAKRPIETDDWDSLRRKMRQGIERSTERLRVKGQFEPARTMPDGSSTACQGVDKEGALLVLIFRYFKGQKLELAERFSQLSHSIRYSQDVTGCPIEPWVPDVDRQGHSNVQLKQEAA